MLDAARDFDPDVVLLDIAMPDMSGHAVARTLRAQLGVEAPVMIGISGRYQGSCDRTLAALNGFSHYLLKPYDLRALLTLLG